MQGMKSVVIVYCKVGVNKLNEMGCLLTFKKISHHHRPLQVSGSIQPQVVQMRPLSVS